MAKADEAEKRPHQAYVRDEHDPDILRINPGSLAQPSGRKARYGNERVEMVNISPAVVALQDTKDVERTINGETVIVVEETGDEIHVLPLQCVEYHASAMNALDSPFVPRETSPKSPYTVTPEQLIEYFDKRIPDIAFEDAWTGYVRWSNDSRGDVMRYADKRRQAMKDKALKVRKLASR